MKNVYYGIICHSKNILYSASYLIAGIAANLIFPTLLNHSLKHRSLKVTLTDSDYLPCDTSKTSGVSNDNLISDDKGDIFEDLKTLRRNHPTQFLCAYLNISSLRYKFCMVQDVLMSNIVDMLFLAETKIDETFTDTQFRVNGFHFHGEQTEHYTKKA